MKKLLAILFCLLATSSLLDAQDRQFPVIKGYGGIYDITDADLRPDPSQTYKIAIDLINAPKSRKDVNYSLERVARLINLHAIGGVPANQIQVVVVAHSSATYSMVNDALYKEKFGVKNPNAPLITALNEAGVQLLVCGQSIKGRDIAKSQLYPGVKVATSMLTAITTLQLQGYAMLQF